MNQIKWMLLFSVIVLFSEIHATFAKDTKMTISQCISFVDELIRINNYTTCNSRCDSMFTLYNDMHNDCTAICYRISNWGSSATVDKILGQEVVASNMCSGCYSDNWCDGGDGIWRYADYTEQEALAESIQNLAGYYWYSDMLQIKEYSKCVSQSCKNYTEYRCPPGTYLANHLDGVSFAIYCSVCDFGTFKDTYGCVPGTAGCEEGNMDKCTSCAAATGEPYGNNTTTMGASSITDCVIYAGTELSDTTGDFTYTNDCYYTP